LKESGCAAQEQLDQQHLLVCVAESKRHQRTALILWIDHSIVVSNGSHKGLMRLSQFEITRHDTDSSLVAHHTLAAVLGAMVPIVASCRPACSHARQLLQHLLQLT
jgi:hypothetical protein